MATTNPITGDAIQTKITSDAYRDNYDRIFTKRTVKESLPVAYDGKVDEKAELNLAIDTAMTEINKSE